MTTKTRHLTTKETYEVSMEHRAAPGLPVEGWTLLHQCDLCGFSWYGTATTSPECPFGCEPEPEKCCGTCRHYIAAKGVFEAGCSVPLPPWAQAASYDLRENDGTDCSLWEEKP